MKETQLYLRNVTLIGKTEVNTRFLVKLLASKSRAHYVETADRESTRNDIRN